MILSQTKITNSANSGLDGYLHYINDKNHINHREAKELGEIQRLERVKTLDRKLLQDGSCKNKGVSMILPIPTCFDSLDKQQFYTNEFMNYFCKELGIDKNSLAYEMVIHNHINKDGNKNYHAHIVLVDRQLNTSPIKEVKGKKRYYKMVEGKKVRCSKNEPNSFFEYDKSKNELAKTFGKHFYLNKAFEYKGVNYFVRDFSSRSMPLLASTIEKRFLETFDKDKLIEKERKTPKNISEFSYLKIGKRIKIKDKYTDKTYLKYYQQRFRIVYNNKLKQYIRKLHDIRKQPITKQDDLLYIERRNFVNEITNLNNQVNERIKALNPSLRPFKFNVFKHKQRSVYNKTIKRVKKPKQKNIVLLKSKV